VPYISAFGVDVGAFCALPKCDKAGELVGGGFGVLGFCVCVYAVRPVGFRLLDGSSTSTSSSTWALPRLSPGLGASGLISVLAPPTRLGLVSPLGVLFSVDLTLEVASVGGGSCCSKGRPGKREFLPGVGFILR